MRDLSGPSPATQLIDQVHDNLDRGLIIELDPNGAVYPNGAVPFAATYAYLKDCFPEQIEMRFGSHSRQHITDPLTIPTYDRTAGHTLTNSVWRYRSESEAQRLVHLFVEEALRDQIRCEEGVIDSITWCLYEVMDNVFQHSRAEAGFVMMQLHKETRNCAVAVADTGIGIQKSLALAGLYREPGEAIDHSLQQGVTSKGGENQGNGLFGLRRAVEVNGGKLSVMSGFGIWHLRDGRGVWATDRGRTVPDWNDHQSTLVDWQLDCSKKVRIEEALGRRRQSSEFLETIEDDDGVHRVSVQELEESLGSRKLGAEIRTRLENYLSAGAKFVLLDFKGVGVVSSSFADEVVGKLAASMGELEFRRRVFVESASVTNRGLVERAIALRLERLDP